MEQLTFEVKLENFQELEIFKEAIKKDVIETGLDLPIQNSLEELKNQLRFILNEKVPAINSSNTKAPEGIPNLDMPKSDQELLQHLTGIDIDKIRGTKDYTSGIEAGVVVSDNYRVRLRLPVSSEEDIEENYQKAIQFFNNAIIVFKDSVGNLQYYLNPGIDLSQFVKIVCSRDNGVTERSKDKFEKYKSSNRMTRQGQSEIGRFTEWSLKQVGVQEILKNFINITPVIGALKSGDYDEASFLLGRNKNGSRTNDLIDKVDDLKNGKNLGPSAASYNNLVQLVANLDIEKTITSEETEYKLVSKYNSTETGIDDFLFEVTKEAKLWIITNTNKWIYALVRIIEKTISTFEK